MKTLFLSIVPALLLSACSGVEKSAGQVLENANSVVKTESAIIWVPKGGTAPAATPSPANERKKASSTAPSTQPY